MTVRELRPVRERAIMEPGPARSAAGAGGDRRGGAFALPAAGSRGRAGKAVLAAAGLARALGAVTGPTAALAAAAVATRTAVAVNAHPRFGPGPCINPVCRPGCDQRMASGGPAAVMATAQPSGAATALHAVAAAWADGAWAVGWGRP
jgi:hypothetical protein